MVTVKEVSTSKELKEFIEFPNTLYKDCPEWTPDLYYDEVTNLRKDKNPAFEYCEAKYFMAYKDGKLVGRIAGILSHKANETWHRSRVRFSRVDFIDDDEVVDALFDAVIQWGKEKGCNEIHGPIGFCDLDKEGMLIEGHDQFNLFITTYCYPYYKTQMERMGFGKSVDWVEYKVYVPEKVPERLEKLSSVIMRRQKLSLFRYQRKKELKPKIEEIFRLINDAYEQLYGVVALSETHIQHYVKQFLPLVQKDLLTIILDHDGKVCAFGLLMPALGEATKKSNGKLFPLGWYRMLRALKNSKALDMYLVAIRPDLQNMGLNAILMCEILKSAIARKIEFAETGPELETNDKVQALWKGFDAVQHKRRRCWIKSI